MPRESTERMTSRVENGDGVSAWSTYRVKNGLSSNHGRRIDDESFREGVISSLEYETWRIAVFLYTI